LNQNDPLRELAQATEAPYNAFDTHDKQQKQFCHSSTRTALLKEIYAWADAQDEQCVYWLTGLAGTGKSTIARTVARRHNDLKNLGASFFFSKGGRDVSHAGKFVTSIAVQIASNVQATREHIREVARRPCDISKLFLRDQWQDLILRPLSALKCLDGITSIVLVIDALDECDNETNLKTVIELLTEAQALRKSGMRVFMTSRPEAAIRHRIGQMSGNSCRSFRLHLIPADIVDADIELFLEDHLTIIGQKQYLPASWSGHKTIAQMAKKASGLFIWASTAVLYIQEGKQSADRRLRLILEQDGDGSVDPEKHLDKLYLTVLRNSLSLHWDAKEKEHNCKRLRLVLGTLAVLREPLSVRALNELLAVGERGIESILQDLHAIIDIAEDENGMLRLHHPSFRDFLLDDGRCADANFFVRTVDAQCALTWKCMDLMKRYFEQDEWKYGTAKSKLDEKVYEKRSCPAEMGYACRNWVRHLQRSGMRFPREKQARFFIEKHAVNWAVMLIHCHDGPIPTDDIYELEQWLSVSCPNARSWLKH